jgi:flavin reductase (DIM6/NTAB) family NADH-FMN oxidoreductase RutF
MMKTFDPKEMKTAPLHGLLLSAVAPRPIAFASTINAQGEVNLSPFSFFNVYSSNPPIMVFSSNRSGKTGETKDTYKNIKEIPEVVINIVTYDMVQQASLSSVAYPRGVNEFEKAGLTMLASTMIRPPRVAESPVQFECKVNEVIELGDQGGAGNLFICEIVKMHVDETVLTGEDKIDPLKMNQVGRCGDNYYIRLTEETLFEVPKPVTTIGIGVDAIPLFIRQSKILTGNDLGMLGNVTQLPTPEEILAFCAAPMNALYLAGNEEERIGFAKQLLVSEEVHRAWCLLMADRA